MGTTLRCTARLLKAMRVRPAEGAPEQTSLLGDWTANLVRVSRIQLVVAVSEPTRLGVVIDAAPYATVPLRLADALVESLRDLGVPLVAAIAEAEHLIGAPVSTSNSKSVLGTLNQFAWEVECDLHYGKASSARDLSRRLARTIVVNPRHVGMPADRVREAFGLPVDVHGRRGTASPTGASATNGARSRAANDEDGPST